jgi:signal transduction histidine kinase
MDSSEDSARAVAAIARMDAVPTLLKVLCEITGMRVAVVARVTDKTWTACAVKDEAHFGLKPGMELPVNTTLCFDSRASRAPSSSSTRVPTRATATMRRRSVIRSRATSRCRLFAPTAAISEILSALDPSPAKVAEPRILSMFTEFAALIASQLDHQLLQEQEHRALLDERAAGELREQFIAILGHDLRNPLHAVYASGDMLERRLTDPKSLVMALAY